MPSGTLSGRTRHPETIFPALVVVIRSVAALISSLRDFVFASKSRLDSMPAHTCAPMDLDFRPGCRHCRFEGLKYVIFISKICQMNQGSLSPFIDDILIKYYLTIAVPKIIMATAGRRLTAQLI